MKPFYPNHSLVYAPLLACSPELWFPDINSKVVGPNSCQWWRETKSIFFCQSNLAFTVTRIGWTSTIWIVISDLISSRFVSNDLKCGFNICYNKCVIAPMCFSKLKVYVCKEKTKVFRNPKTFYKTLNFIIQCFVLSFTFQSPTRLWRILVEQY